jgi:hypothetical protein
LGTEGAGIVFLESSLLGGGVAGELIVIIIINVVAVMGAKATSKWSSLARVAVSYSVVALLDLDSKVAVGWSLLVVSPVRASVSEDAAIVVWMIIAAIICSSRLVCPKAVLVVMVKRLLLLLVWISWASIISIADLISRWTPFLRLREASSITRLELLFGRIWRPAPASISSVWRIATLADWIVSQWLPPLTRLLVLLEAGLR